MKIAIFYHVYQTGISALIYQQQLHRLYCSSLINAADYIHIGVNGRDDLFNPPNKAKIKYNSIWNDEKETLIDLKNFAQKNQDYKILYLHTKGASKSTLVANSWRLMLEYFTIDKWEDCVQYLTEYDCVGHSFIQLGDTVWGDGSVTKNQQGCYPGNFWWANASYIATLNHDYLETEYRFDREFWIGTNPNIKPKSFLDNYYYNPYSNYYKEVEYL